MEAERIEAAPTELRPDKLGAMLRFSFYFLLIAGAGIGPGYVAGCVARLYSNLYFMAAVPIYAMLLGILVSQLAAQTLISLLIADDKIVIRILTYRSEITATQIKNIYLAPNVRYNNIVIDTNGGPHLLSDLLWSGNTYSSVEKSLRRWADNKNIEISDVDTIWIKTPQDRLARQLLLRCFRKRYIQSAAVLFFLSTVSFFVAASQ